MVRDVVIFDTTLRDGEQAPGNTMTPEEKMQVARQLDALNVDVIEAGFPAASAGDYRGVQAAIAEGATTVNLPDTVGFALPEEYGEIFRAIRERVPGASGITLSAHCHDDLGLAVANSLAAIAAGAGQVECTVNGIGERAGNAALEEIVMASHVRPQVAAFRCNVETRELYRTSRLLSHVTGVFPQPNKAIVGRNAFAHEAGIHQHGVMQNGLTYEIMRPGTVGGRARRRGQRRRPDRGHVRRGERDRRAADRGGEPRRPVRHARPRQPGAGIAPGARERQVAVRARRLDRYRRGVRPRARQC